ncbi:MAG: C40 family peptidase [bacterium]|nr:C40 family peptidase [bacterium]
MKLPRLYTCLYVCILALAIVLSACKHTKQEQKVSEASHRPAEVAKIPATPPVKAKNQHNPSTELEQKVALNARELRENKLYAFINEWYGSPYKYGGCQKSGIDCSCFTNLLYQQVYGKNIPRSAAEIFKSCDEIGLEEVGEGDFVFFKIGGKSISHVGVYLRKNYFIHASTSEGVVLNNLEEAYYKKYFFCAGKVKKS